jgi:energy-coupling factor transporter ATP-binding protein EcfA2
MIQARIELTPELKASLLDPKSLPSELTIKGIRYALKTPVAAGHKAVVWKAVDEYGRPRAVKFAIYEDYVDRSFLSELALAAQLETYDEFAKFIAADILDLELPLLDKKKFVCFIESWISGFTLEDFLKNYEEQVSCSFLRSYVEKMCSALDALRTENLRHDDLHARNVMLEQPAHGLLSDTLKVRVIDTGSLKPLNVPTKKSKDDHRNFVEHLISIQNTILKKKRLSVVDHRFLNECISLYNSMLDDDPSIALTSPEQIKTQFELAYTRSNYSRASQTLTLQSPFEFISAEHIADDRLLVDIFAQSCPWLSKVDGPDPCLVTGPRGCGKSTIFRWLSLKAHLHKPTSEIEQFRISGFYLSCSSDLQNRLSWIKTQAVAEKKFRREIIHYFNLILAKEVVHTLCLIRNREDRESFWGIGQAQEERIHKFLKDALFTSHWVIQGVSRLQQALEMIEVAMFHCHVQMLKGLNLEWTTPETFLGDLTTLLTKEISFFKDRPIAFLLDDFSTHRLPEPVQIILNRIIWERRDTHIFKLSSEKYGAVLNDSFDATADVSREMVEIDCGQEYLALDDHEQRGKARRFATELLANRLNASKYTGTPEQLLGNSEWEEGSLARALKAKRQNPGRRDNQYHGLECIADLCSGDVSTLLLVYRRIFEMGGVDRTTTSRVPRHVQHRAIGDVSGELLTAIKTHHPYGNKMYRIVREFGTLVRRILEDGKEIKLRSGYGPSLCPRIEVDQDFNNADEELSSEQANLARELVRRAIFIEMEPGRSRHKYVTTLRWQLRRVFLPAFGAALSKNDAVKWRPAQFKFFLVDPKNSCERELQRRTNDDSQNELFN